MANAIRTYFGDGSELGVRMVYATEETPLGTAGSVLNARDELDERFLVISGDVLTDIDLSAVVDFHEPTGAPWPPWPWRRSRTPSSSGSSSPTRTGRSSASWRSPPGARSSATPSTPASTCSNPRSSTSSPKAGRWTSRARSSPPSSPPAARSSATWPRATGRTWAPPRPTSRPTRTSSTSKVQVEIEGFPLRPGVWLGKGSTVDPTADVGGPAIIGDNCSIGAGVVLGEYTTLGSNVRVAEGAEVRRSVINDNGYLGAGVRVEGAVRGPVLRPAPRGPAASRGRCSARAAWSAPTPRSGPGSRSTRSRRWRAGPSSTPPSSGSPGARGPCSAETGSGASPTSTSAPSWPSACRWPGPPPWTRATTVTASRDTSRAARVLKRAIMVGCNAAGVNVEDLEVATDPGHPPPRPHLGQPGRGHRPAGPRRPPVGGASASSTREGLDLDRDGPAQGRAPLPPRGLPPGAGRRDRRHRLPAACRRAVHRRPGGRRRPLAGPAPPASRSCSTSRTGRPAS